MPEPRVCNPLYQSCLGSNQLTENYYMSVNQALALLPVTPAQRQTIAQGYVVNPLVRSVTEAQLGAASNVSTTVNAIALGTGNQVKDFGTQLQSGAVKVADQLRYNIASDINTTTRSFIGGMQQLEDTTLSSLRNVVQGPVEAVTEAVDKSAQTVNKTVDNLAQHVDKTVGEVGKWLLLILGVVVVGFLLFSSSKSGQILSKQSTPIVLIVAALIAFLVAPEFLPAEALVGGAGVFMAVV